MVARSAVIGTAGAVAIGAAFGLGNLPDEAESPATGGAALDAMFHERSGQAASRGGIGRAPVTAPAASLAQAPAASPTPSAPTHAVSAAPVAGCESYTGNRLVGCNLLSEFGFGVDQMASLDKLWTHESGWNHTAENPYSGAYGIPQALPGSKMSSFGDDWQTNPATQIRWGLDYIKNRYGSPDAAYSFFQSNGWY